MFVLPHARVVAPVRPDDPPRGGLLPLEAGDLGREARVVVQVEMPADPLAVFEDLGCLRVLLAGHVPGLLEEREVDHRRRVAHRARVPVPVPGATEVAALLDDADVGDPGVLELGAGDEPGEATTDERHRHLIRERLAWCGLDVRVFDVVGVAAGHLDVLVVAVGPQALVALLVVPGPEGIRSIGPSGVVGAVSSSEVIAPYLQEMGVAVLSLGRAGARSDRRAGPIRSWTRASPALGSTFMPFAPARPNWTFRGSSRLPA